MAFLRGCKSNHLLCLQCKYNLLCWQSNGCKLSLCSQCELQSNLNGISKACKLCQLFIMLTLSTYEILKGCKPYQSFDMRTLSTHAFLRYVSPVTCSLRRTLFVYDILINLSPIYVCNANIVPTLHSNRYESDACLQSKCLLKILETRQPVVDNQIPWAL